MAMSVYVFRGVQISEDSLSLSNYLANTSVYSLFKHSQFPLIKTPDNLNGNFVCKIMIN